jgi:starch phosphorylase
MMSGQLTTEPPMSDMSDATTGEPSILARRLERLGLAGDEHAWIDRYILCEHLVDPPAARARQKFEAVARFSRDLIAHRWVRTRQSRERANPKRINYLSMEFLIGRTLANNLMNMAAHPLVERALQREGWDLAEIFNEEPDAGLGNGGLGRLAACFIESLATLQYSAMGYGLRYQFGIFRQALQNGYQVETPDHWLLQPDPFEVPRPGKVYPVTLSASFELRGTKTRIIPNRPSTILGIAYDRPVVGYGARCVNTLRLWGASAPEDFNLTEFSQGDFVGAVLQDVSAESLIRVLYPDDSTDAGRTLRFLQQHFLVSCSLQDIVARFLKDNGPRWPLLPEHVAIQLNDTHPSLAVAELMRILLDQGQLGWNEAWEITTRTLAYTNHTLLPEALERWPVELFELLVPRHLEIIFEINKRFLDDVARRYPGDVERQRRMSLIEETPVRRVRMAHLAVVGTHSTNGVAGIHSELLRTRLLRDFAEVFPERFNNKTNGVTPRRWLLLANPALAQLITDCIGDGWVTDLERLQALVPMAADSSVQDAFRRVKREAKLRFVDWLRRTGGPTVDPDTIFDSHIKRIHEYKRQLLNILHVITLYHRLRASSSSVDLPARTFFFAGKAAPAYRIAKLIIKLINNVARVIEQDPAARGRLHVLFLPDYNVTLAERLIPASDISEQISTAGFEASGTGNMKFMMNGALTVGTRDGATIEMAQAVGEDNMFLFGLTAAQVADSRAWYDPWWHYHHEPATRDAIDSLFSGQFSEGEDGVFEPLRAVLLTGGDYYMHLADLTSYSEAQSRAAALYAAPAAWSKAALLNVACSGPFSSDRTIAEYAADIWQAKPSPVV